MSRDDGFPVADVDAAYFEDRKVKKLWRVLGPDLGRMCHALCLHQATVYGSWREGSRVTVDDAVPVWLTVDEALVDALRGVGLFDASRRVPTRSWKRWYGPAWERREARRMSGALGGLRARGKRSESDAIAELQRRHSEATPVRPSYRPTDRPSRPRAPAREAPSNNGATTGEGRVPMRETFAALGLPGAPESAGRVKP